MTERRKPGRKSKGDRRPIITRLPVALAEAAKQHAAQQGKSVNDLVGELLAAETGVPYDPQEALPIGA